MFDVKLSYLINLALYWVYIARTGVLSSRKCVQWHPMSPFTIGNSWGLDLVEQYTEITTQVYYSYCNTQLNHSTITVPITGLSVLTVTMPGISSFQEGMYRLMPAQARCSLQSWLIVQFSHTGLG